VERYHWSLFEIDSTDFESLLRFVFHAAQQTQPQQANETFARKPNQVFCDEVKFL
jgi:hypothetical protein